MKLRLHFALCLLLAVVSCSKKEPAAAPEGGYSYFFGLEATKSALTSGHVVWESGDKVGCFPATSRTGISNRCTAVEDFGDFISVNTGDGPLAVGDRLCFYAPYNAANDGNYPSQIRMAIPSDQSSGDAGAMPLVAVPFTVAGPVPESETEAGTLQFFNLGAVVQLNIFSTNAKYRSEKVQEVMFSAGAPVAGFFNYDISGFDGNRPAEILGLTETEVVVHGGGAAVGQSSTAATQFRMVVAPGSYKGKYVVRTDGAVYTFAMSESVAYARADVRTLDLDLASASRNPEDLPDIPPTPQSSPFITMTLNIREGSNWDDRKGPIVSMIKGESPDIVGFQEVKDYDMWDHLMGKVDPWEYLKNNLSDYTGVRFGSSYNACLYKTSRFEVSGTGSFDLDENGNRNALYMTVHDRTDDKYFFYITTHFPLSASEQASAEVVLEGKIAELNTGRYPVVTMGDYNTVYGNSIFDNFKKTMNNTRYSADEVYSIANRDMYTYNAFGDTSKDRQKVDHIWVSKTGLSTKYYITLTQEIRKYGSVDYLSDHYPVIATLSF